METCPNLRDICIKAENSSAAVKLEGGGVLYPFMVLFSKLNGHFVMFADFKKCKITFKWQHLFVTVRDDCPQLPPGWTEGIPQWLGVAIFTHGCLHSLCGWLWPIDSTSWTSGSRNRHQNLKIKCSYDLVFIEMFFVDRGSNIKHIEPEYWITLS